MVPDNFKILVDKLKAKTTKKEAIWTKTSRSNEFKLDLGKGAITVDSWEADDDYKQLVDIAVINEDGDRVDSIQFSSMEKEDYKYLIELHAMAKRAYYKVDETFKTIFKELDSDKTIGTERKPSPDDLPF